MSKLLYLFKALLRATEISSKNSVFGKFGGRWVNNMHHFFSNSDFNANSFRFFSFEFWYSFCNKTLS